MRTFLITTLLLLSSCTSNERTRLYGGTQAMTLPPCTKLVNITWKEANLWYLTRRMRPDETPEFWTFDETSSFGVLNATITIQEQACEKKP